MLMWRMSDEKDIEKSKKMTSEGEDDEVEEEQGVRSNISTQLARSQHHPPVTFLTQTVNLMMEKDHSLPSLTFIDLP